MNLHHGQKLVMQRRGEHAISRVSALDTIYLRGGARVNGRIAPPSGEGEAWTDCSGAATFVAAVMNLPIYEAFARNGETGTIWTGSWSKVGVEGESDYFTVYIKDPFEEVPGEGHMIMRLRRRPHWNEHDGVPRFRWAECGGSDNPSNGGGLHWFKPTPERIDQFPIHRCFKGF